jgi:CubicO group peptidase (beta-lactamase class C family)
VVRDGELVYKRGYGMANLEYGIALSPNSVFRTASVGKQFTAMAIAILAQKGELSLDDPLSRFFPEFPDWAETTTVRHLVHHTSGIRDYLTLAWLAGMGDEAHYSDEFALDLLSRQEALNFLPGNDHLYSNSGYLLLAHIVQRATGQSLREWAAEHMFGPLGMHHSHFHDDHTHIVPSRADGYAPTEGGYEISMTTLDMVGGGGVYTTVEDFLLWDRNFYDNTLGTGGQDLIETVTTPGSLNHDESMTYAFGLQVDEHRGLPMVSHGGAFVGFRTDTIRFPEQHLSVVVYCNRADANPSQFSREVAALYLADVMENKKGPDGVETGEDQGLEVARADLQRLTGHYWNEERRGSREIALDDDQLYLLFNEENRFPLVPLGDDQFALTGLWYAIDVRFESPPDGGLQVSLQTEGSEEPTIYERYTPNQPTSEQLEAYAGRYYSEELGVDYDLVVAGEALRFHIVRHEAHQLEPVFGEIFSNSDYGTFEFQRDADGAIESFILDAGRVRGLEFQRQ